MAIKDEEQAQYMNLSYKELIIAKKVVHHYLTLKCELV